LLAQFIFINSIRISNMNKIIRFFSSSFRKSSIHAENTKILIDSLESHFQSLPSMPVKPIPSSPPLSTTLPQHPIPFSEVLKTIKESVFPNTTHWKHPNFFAYFPSAVSWFGIQGSLVEASLGVCFTKSISPVAQAMEVIVSDWLAEMLQLPQHFWHKHGPGGGLTYGTASESVLTAMACARLNSDNKNVVAYATDQSHFSIPKAARVLEIPIRLIKSEYDPQVQNYPIDIAALKEQIAKDKKAGLKPIFLVGCVGATNLGANDDLLALGQIAEDEKMWFHVDAAYAGSLAMLPELRHVLNGVELCSSLNVNSSKLMLTGQYSSSMWVKDVELLTKGLTQETVLMKAMGDIDFRNVQIPLGRNCNGAKLWMVLQQLGAEGLREYLRQHIRAGKYMEELLQSDYRFEMMVKREYGLVCFRAKGENEKTDRIIERLVYNPNILMLGSRARNKSFIRFSPSECDEDLQNVKWAFELVKEYLE
jgi:glutamate/tyrosine decarboxylase-like PLP-dependent enzyme